MDIDPLRDPAMSPVAHGVPALSEDSPRGADLFVRGRGGPIRLLAHFPRRNAERAPLLVLFTAAEAGTRHDLDSLAETVSQRAAAVVLVAVPPLPAAGEVTVGRDAAATVLDWAVDHADQLRADAERLVVAGMGAAACLVVSLVSGASPEFRPAVRDQVLIDPPRKCTACLGTSAVTATRDGASPISTTVVCSDDVTSTLIALVTRPPTEVRTAPEGAGS